MGNGAIRSRSERLVVPLGSIKGGEKGKLDLKQGCCSPSEEGRTEVGGDTTDCSKGSKRGRKQGQ